jgi:hypothetical protein
MAVDYYQSVECRLKSQSDLANLRTFPATTPLACHFLNTDLNTCFLVSGFLKLNNSPLDTSPHRRGDSKLPFFVES